MAIPVCGSKSAASVVAAAARLLSVPMALQALGPSLEMLDDSLPPLDVRELWTLGRALGRAEIVGFSKKAWPHRKGTFGPYLRLGFAHESDRLLVEQQRQYVDAALCQVVGDGPQVGDVIDLAGEEGWSELRTGSYVVPLMLQKRPSTALRDLVTSDQLLRLRHARWEATATYGSQASWGQRLDVWFTSAVSDPHEQVLKNAIHRNTGCHVDVRHSPDADDWGDIDLGNDKLNVLLVGPKSSQHVKADVATQLGALTDYLSFESDPLALGASPESVLEALERILDRVELPDVVLAFRGGYKDDERLSLGSLRPRLGRAIEKLLDMGIEVVLGIGHGADPILNDGPQRFGAFDLITPTAAAHFVASHHVSNFAAQRLMRQLQMPAAAIRRIF
jgi:hypothetical protein